MNLKGLEPRSCLEKSTQLHLTVIVQQYMTKNLGKFSYGSVCNVFFPDWSSFSKGHSIS